MRKPGLTFLLISAIGVADAAFAQSHDSHAPAVRQTIAEWAKGARLFDGLGTYHRHITTRSPLAQRYFDQGMRFVWAFNHDEATRSFAKAAQLDPSCASCYWGVALTLGPNYNMAMMSSQRARAGWSAVRHAQAHARSATPVEQALIAAVRERYRATREVDPSNSKPLLAAYVRAMRRVAARYPNDLDVQTMYAEALMNTNPWKLWNADGTANPGTDEIVRILRRVIAKDPGHPGANHYYIHAIEASSNPELGVPSAEVLRRKMPSAGHLVHMPAHILQRVGRYEEAAEANRKGAAADLAYLRRTAAPDYYPMYLVHNFQFLGSAAGMEGRRDEAISALKDARLHMSDQLLFGMPGLDWGASYIYDGYIKFGLWDDMLKEARPSPQLPGATISFLQSRATALAATGELDAAKTELANAQKLIDVVPADATQGLNEAKPLYVIGQLKADARFASAQGRRDEAIRLLTEAVAMEDKLAYNEPSDMLFPTRHLLGAELITAGRHVDAEAVYREDLKRNPENGWALFGLSQALALQKREAEASVVRAEFERAWIRADVQLSSTAF